MKKRKERIEQEKALQFTENFKSVKKATTYIGTTVIMGTAGIGLSRTKALADSTVQVANGQANNNNNDSAEAVNNNNSGQPATNTQAASSSTANNNTSQTQSQQSQSVASQANAAQPQSDSSQQQDKTVASQDTAAASENSNSLLRSSVTVYSSPQMFIDKIAPSAMQVARQRGLYASMMIAQAALESGWGSSTLSTSAYNLFGVKWNGYGAFVQMNTNEYYSGSNHTVSAKFQKYNSYTESLNNYANLIVGHFPNSTVGKAASVEQAADNLAHGVYGTYATSPTYAATLKNIINNYNLKKYDSQTGSTGNTSTTLPNANSGQNNQPSNTSTTPTANGQYSVKSGDTLYHIATTHGMTVASLKSLNNLTSNNIYVGQKLKLTGSTASNNGSANSQPSKPTNSQPNQPTQSKPADSNSQTYKVQKKDSLWSIAQKYQTTVANLRAWNNLKSDIIYVDQTLKVSASGANKQPGKQTSGTSQKPAADNSKQQQQADYTVKAHDSLWSIAHSHGLSVAQIKSINKLSSDLIFVGQKLTLKSQAKPGTSQTSHPNKDQKQSGQSNTAGTYIVKSGDSLWAIAQKHNMTVSALKSLNKLTSDLISVGQKLQVKGSQVQTGQNNNQSSKTTTANKQTNGTYVVKKNDSLWSIANAHNTTIAKLRQLNHLTGSVIYIGQTLKVQGRASINKTTSKPASAAQKSSYVVQAHDSLWRIATRNKMTVNQLKSLNHLVSDTIYVGQTLKLK